MADANMYVLNPFFQTRSFDDMVKPLAMYAQAYKEQEAKIEDMTDKAAALEWIANQDPKSQTAALYRDMSAKIKGIRDDMMVNGLQGGTRSRILGARRMYSANSAEITRRYEDMQKYQQRMEQLYDKDNSMVFSPESQNVSLDDFAGGKRPKIKAISGNEIMARGAAIGKRLTSQIFGDGVEGTVAGEQFWKFYQENGMNDKALRDWLYNNNMEDKYQMVKEVIDGVYDSFKDFAPDDQLTLKKKFIEGVYSGAVYNKQISYQPNGEYINAAQREDIRLKNEQLKLSQEESARQNLALQLQGKAAGYEVDIKNNKISKDLSQPDKMTIKHDDGTSTIVYTPWNEDGSPAYGSEVSVHVGKDGEVISTSHAPGQDDLNDSNNASDDPISQTEKPVTDAVRDQVIKDGDTDNYVTWTYKGDTKIKKVSGTYGNEEGNDVGHYGRRWWLPNVTSGGEPFRKQGASPVLDWGKDVDAKFDNEPIPGVDKKYRKWILTDEAYMPPHIKKAYETAKRNFQAGSTKDNKRKMSNYNVYYVEDPSRPNVKPEFMFVSKNSKIDFVKANDAEARAIREMSIAVQAAEADRVKVSKKITDHMYENAMRGYHPYYDPINKMIRYNSKATSTKQTVNQNTTATVTTIKPVTKGDSLAVDAMNGGFK